MSELKKFVYYPMEKPKLIQPDSPVYVHAYTLAVQPETGASFVQLRMVNRSEHGIHSVFLHVSGLDSLGNTQYEVSFLPVAACHAPAHSDFGEDHLLFLPAKEARYLEICVEDVLFEDGMIWRKQAKDRLMTAEQAGWTECSCGMKNPAHAELCAFCGVQLPTQEPVAEQKEEELPEEPSPAEAEPQAAPTCSEPPSEPEGVQESETTQDIEEPKEPEILPVVEVLRTTEEPQAEGSTEEQQESEAEEKVQELTPEPEEQPAESVPVPVDLQAASLAQLLAPLRERAEQRALLEATQEQPQETEEEGSEETEPEALIPKDLSTEGGFMQETTLLMQEIQRRILAKQNGESVSEPVPEETSEQDNPEDGSADRDMKRANRGILFWSLMVVLMILLLLAGFFGVLYYKGYFR